jgi:type IV pilus assembly protein PilB
MAKVRKRIEMKLGDILVALGAITKEQLGKALVIKSEDKHDVPTGKILMDLGFATDKDVIRAFIVQYHVPYLPVKNCTLEPDVMKLLPAEMVQRNQIIPLDIFGDTLTVATPDPLNKRVFEEIERLSRCAVRPVIDTHSEIRLKIDSHFSVSSAV